MKPSYDSSQEEVDKPEKTASKSLSAIMDQNNSSIRSNQVMSVILVFSGTWEARILPFENANPFICVFQVVKT